ncbi:MAG: Mrp/NBP35 family ATP-binding protein [Firmicutes bacterium]|nr:Mrp/NBP35 family ATP-binding protein [Bacillota bacterium]
MNNQFAAELNEFSKVGKVIGVVSGKGGVGKSLVTSLLAVVMNRKGYKVGILDGDITGPSIPKAFGISGKAPMDERGVHPALSKAGISVMSINLLLDEDTDPVVWRGPLVGGAVKQFWTDVIWDDIDYMFIDMPPGTGDVPLTVFQSIPVDGIIVVTSPQELVSMIVAKAVKMAELMNIPVIGLVENMSYFVCPDCGSSHHIFGESHIDQIALTHSVPVLAKLPIDPTIASFVDEGRIEELSGYGLEQVASLIE